MATRQDNNLNLTSVRVSGINIEWNSNQGTCTFEGLPVVLAWADSTLAGLMSGVQSMVGTDRFLLALQSQGRKSVDDDWKVIATFPDFVDGFRAIANIAAVAGWGKWELTYFDEGKKECHFRVTDSWEGNYQKSLGVCWGSGMLAGKMAGYCTKLFGTNCWADQTAFIARGEPYDEFTVTPSLRSIEREIENLLSSDRATRADMAVALRRLEAEIAERRKSEEKYRELVQNANSIILRMDTKGNVTFFNEFAQTFFGFTEEEILGRNVVGTIVPQRSMGGKDLSSMIADIGRDPNRYAANENENVRKNGERVWIAWTNTPIVDNEGHVVEVLCVGNDITARRQSEENLREREEMIRALVETSQDWIWSIDLNGRHTYSNPAVETILGYLPEELVGKLSFDLMHGDDRTTIETLLPQKIAEKAGWHNLLLRWRHRNGDWRYLESNAVPVLNSKSEVIGFRGVDRDITEKRHLEEQLSQAQKMEAIGQLAGGVAHDFNNLLQAILGYADLIRDDLAPEASHYFEIEQVHTAAKRAITLTRHLLAFSRRQVIQPEIVDLNDLIASLMKMLGRLIGEHIQLDIVPGHSLGLVRADPGQIEQVIMNLCINARDAMPNGGRLTIETSNVSVECDCRNSCASAREGRYALISVTDNGCGMDKEILDHVFEPFFTTKKAGEGTGLGLSTVYGIVKQHEGFVYAYSEVGIGTTFKVYLPISEHLVPSIGDSSTRSAPEGTETILLAEDEEMIQDLAARILRSAGYTILQARNGREALQILEKQGDKIDLAFLDVVMPHLSGHEVQKRIHEKLPHLKFLFSSGYSTNAIHTNFVLNQGMHFIQKPYQRGSLLKKLREVLDG
jgi:two-component system cell cycle sensor histidine kinase/response regulator CckA